MITGTKSVPGVPAAQRQPRDRQQRRRQRQKRQPSDGDDGHQEVGRHRKVDGYREVDDAAVIDISGPKRHPANTQSGALVEDRKAARHPGRKQRHVDIRI